MKPPNSPQELTARHGASRRPRGGSAARHVKPIVISLNFENVPPEEYDFVRGPATADRPVLGEALARLVGPVGRAVVEVGVGTGRLSLLLAEQGVSVVGVDLSFRLLRYFGEQRRSRRAFPIQADASVLPLPESSVEALLLAHLLPFVGEEFADEARRVLAPGGRVVFCEDMGRDEVFPQLIHRVDAYAPRPGLDGGVPLDRFVELAGLVPGEWVRLGEWEREHTHREALDMIAAGAIGCGNYSRDADRSAAVDRVGRELMAEGIDLDASAGRRTHAVWGCVATA